MRLYIGLIGILLAWSEAGRALPACQLRVDFDAGYNPYTACLATEWQLFASADNHAQGGADQGGMAGEVYGSFGFGHLLSLHLKGGVKSAPEPDFTNQVWVKDTEYGFLQLGHPILDSIYAAAGTIDAPFGLNHDLYRLVLPSLSQGLWQRSVQGSRGAIRWHDDLLFEVGVNQDQTDLASAPLRKVISGRLVRNIDLLNGTRLIGSYLSTADYAERAMGFAALIHNDGNRTSLEWVRKVNLADSGKFEQVFRFVYEQEQRDLAVNFVAEEAHGDSYRLSLGARKTLTKFFGAAASIHYQRENLEPVHKHLILLLGLDYRRALSWAEAIP